MKASISRVVVIVLVSAAVLAAAGFAAATARRRLLVHRCRAAVATYPPYPARSIRRRSS